MLVTRGLGPDGLVATAGIGAKASGAGPAIVVRNQWIRQWAIEQILANQAAADKLELEAELRETRKKIKQAPLEIVYTDPEAEQGKEPAKKQRRRELSQPATRAPRPDLAAASREVRAGLFIQQRQLQERLRALEDDIQRATAQAIEMLDLRPAEQREFNALRTYFNDNEQQMLEMFTARAAQKAKKRRQEEEALALLTLLAA
jgi:hypothetical protein